MNEDSGIWRVFSLLALILTGFVLIFVPKRAGSADLWFRSAVSCCQLGTNRRPPKQVCGTQCVCGRGRRRTAEPFWADH
jgi:hypothetical protein